MSIFDINNISPESNEPQFKPLIMLVDDEVENIKVLRQLLEEKFTVMTCLNGEDALSQIKQLDDPASIQLIISDQRMPGLTGVEFLSEVVEIIPETIRIILTGYSDTQAIIDSINKAKLYKFMTKPFDPMELSLTVQRGVEAFQMKQELVAYTHDLERKVEERTEQLQFKNQELQQALENIEQLTLIDPLTQLNNRRFLNKVMVQEIAGLKRELENKSDQHCDGFGLLIIDIDHFKQINDNYGHDSGDQVLTQFANVLRSECRNSDWIVRWDGEEFVIVARGMWRDEIHHLADRLLSAVKNTTFALGSNQALNRTCSIGIACFPFIQGQLDCLTWQQTLNLADQALYVAKRSGRDCWVSLAEKNIVNIDAFYEIALRDLSTLEKTGEITVDASGDPAKINLG